MTTQIQRLCPECNQAMLPEDVHRYAYCVPCRAKHVAAWKDDHTRHAGDTRKGWLIGDECTVTLKGVTYDAKILDMSDTSRHENNYDLMKLELAKTYRACGWNGEDLVSTRTWIHPEPVQSYKLKKPLLRD